MLRRIVKQTSFIKWIFFCRQRNERKWRSNIRINNGRFLNMITAMHENKKKIKVDIEAILSTNWSLASSNLISVFHLWGKGRERILSLEHKNHSLINVKISFIPTYIRVLFCFNYKNMKLLLKFFRIKSQFTSL